MSRKHFEAIAATIKYQLKDVIDNRNYNLSDATTMNYVAGQEEAIKRTARALADNFAYFNPNFNRARFLDACGIPS